MKPLQNGNGKSAQPNVSAVGGITAAPFFDSHALKALELVSSPVWLWDPDSCRILWGNRAATEYWAARSLGSLDEVSSDIGPSKADMMAACAQTAEEGASTLGLWTARRNGRPVTVTCRFTAIKSDAGGTAFLIEPESVPAASSSNKAQRSTRLPDNLLRISNAQAEVFELMTKGTDLEPILGRIATVIEASLDTGRCSILVPGSGTTRLSQCVGPSLPADLKAALKDVETGSETSPFAAAVLRGESMVVTDITAEPAWKGIANLAVRHGLGACLTVPVFSRAQEVLGLITVFYDKAQDSISQDQQVLEAVASLTALAIQHWGSESSWRLACDRLASLASTIPGVVYQRVVTSDGDIRYTYISDGARDLFGVSPEEILADPNALFNCHGPEYRATFRERLLKASKNLELWDVEAQIITRDGEEKWTHAIARPQKQPDGSVVWDGVILDATRIKKAELATTAAAAHTRKTIVESLSQGFILFGSDDRLVVCNRRYLDLFPDLKDIATPGASYEDVAWAEIQFHSHEDSDVILENWLSERLEKHQLPEYTVERQWPNGRWVLIREYRTFDGSTVVFFTDVTDIKVREEKLRRVNRQLDIALSNMSQGLCVFDAERRMVLANNKYGEIFQLSEHFIRKGVNLTDQMDYVFAQFKYNESAASTLVQERLKHIDSGKRCTFFLNFPDGRTVEAVHQPLTDGGSVETFSEW